MLYIVKLLQFSEFPLHSADSTNGRFPVHGINLHIPGKPFFPDRPGNNKLVEGHTILAGEDSVHLAILAKSAENFRLDEQADSRIRTVPLKERFIEKPPGALMKLRVKHSCYSLLVFRSKPGRFAAQ